MSIQHETTPIASSEAMQDLMVEVIALFFLLRAVGKQMGAVTAADGGYWGMLRSLKLEGPQTVPQIARSRPVSRQHIQKLANEMVADGVIEWVENPAHRRSKLLQLTPQGEAVFAELSVQIAQMAAEFAEDVKAEDLQVSVQMLRQLKEKLRRSLFSSD
jgi:DNA-binding MarR family transcriptional regulator